MSSNLRVNNILPSVGNNVAIGTAGGSVTLTGSVTGDITSSGVSTFTTLSATNIVGVSTLGVTTAYVNTLRDPNSSTNNITLNSDGTIGGSCLTQTCRAWVNFNGTGTVAIRASYNVSSITDEGTGDYTVNFTTALADANYAATFGTVRNDAAVRGGNFVCLHRNQAGGGTLPASGSLRITTPEAASSAFDAANVDMEFIYVAIFR